MRRWKTFSRTRRIPLKRGELYLVKDPPRDVKRQRVFAVISRQDRISSKNSSVICAPIFTNFEGLRTQVPVGVAEGLKHASAVYCDGLTSIPKSKLTYCVGVLGDAKLADLDRALGVAVGLAPDH